MVADDGMTKQVVCFYPRTAETQLRCKQGVSNAGAAAPHGSKASVVRKHGGGSPELAENVACMQYMPDGGK